MDSQSTTARAKSQRRAHDPRNHVAKRAWAKSPGSEAQRQFAQRFESTIAALVAFSKIIKRARKPLRAAGLIVDNEQFIPLGDWRTFATDQFETFMKGWRKRETPKGARAERGK